MMLQNADENNVIFPNQRFTKGIYYEIDSFCGPACENDVVFIPGIEETL